MSITDKRELRCWQCNHPAPENLFCRHCNSLQPPTPDYYRFLGLEPKLDLDEADLQRRFYELSRALHPDRYMRRNPTEQRHSLEATAILNDAYRTLRDPVRRAEYILKDNNFDTTEARSNPVPEELLEEVFELNMALEELREGDESTRPQVEQARQHFLALRDQVDADLKDLFRQWDNSGDREVLARIRATLNRRRYIANLVSEVERTLAAQGLGASR